MASNEKNLSEHDVNTIPSAKGKRFGIVVSEYYPEITTALLEGAKSTLIEHGAAEADIFIQYTPGAFELPLGCVQLYKNKQCDAVIAIGCVIKGETDHDQYINQAVASGLMNLSLTSGKPFIFGLLTTDNYQQAVDRAGGKAGNKGIECAVAAIKMLANSNKTKTTVGF